MYLLNAEPENVSARGGAYLQESIDDVVFVNLQFANGVMAHIQLSWLDPHKIRRTTIVGSEKMVVFDDMETTEMVKIYDKGITNNTVYASYGEALSLRFGDITVPYIKMTELLKKDVPAYALELSLRQSCKATRLDVPMWNPFGIQ